MIEIIAAGIVLGITLAFMVGPVFFLLIEISLNKGFKKALVFDAGVIAADVVFIIIIALGSRYINLINNVIWVYAVGGCLIIFYGLYNIASARKKKRSLSENDRIPENNSSDFVYLAKGFFLNFLNVGVLAYWFTTTITLRATLKGDPQESTLMITYFVSTVVAYFFTDLVKIFTAQRIKQKLTPAMLVRIERVVGIILIIFGASLILRGYLASNGIGF